MRSLHTALSSSLTLLAFSALPLAAADMQISDLRLSVGLLSRDYEGASNTTVTDGNGTTSSTSSSEEGRDADENWRGQLQYVHGNLGAGGGFIWGFGIAANHAKWENGAQDARVTTPTLDVLLGYGYAFTPNWHIEVTPFAGYGRAFYSVTDSNSTETDEDSTHYIEYGAKVGTYVSLGNDLVLGVEIPYMVGSFDPDYDYTDGQNNSVSVSDERSNSGFGVLLTIGGRF